EGRGAESGDHDHGSEGERMIASITTPDRRRGQAMSLTVGQPVTVDVMRTAWAKPAKQHRAACARERRRGRIVQVTPRFVAVEFEVRGGRYVECFEHEDVKAG